MPLTPQSEPRRKSSPRWVLAFWLVVVAIRLWSVNHTLALVALAIAALLFLSSLRRTERTSGGAGTVPTSSPVPPPAPTANFETIARPSAPPDARPIEPEIGGAGGKLIVLALVLLGLGLLLAVLWKRLPLHGWHP